VTQVRRNEAARVAILIALWVMFFWRLMTPNAANALHLKEGDFSGQFVAWAGYQAERQAAGEVALWNPYNNAGHPFLADTQSGVFYPPRVMILALAKPTTPGVIYNALQWEAMLHILLASLLMYAFLRRTIERDAGHFGALIGALVFAYGGFMTGYPLLQLAVLESLIWLPLMLYGVHLAICTKPGKFNLEPARIEWSGFVLSGVVLGLSLHGGSPQFAHWCIILTLLYAAHLTHSARRSWRVWLIGAAVFGVVGGGLAAVQLLPALQYYAASARRGNFTFDSQGNGFPPYDVVQFLFPGWLTLWSPLYIGLPGLVLAALALVRRGAGAIFWGAVALVALGLSFGRNTAIYDVTYNLVPGFNLFREQERAAFPVTVAASVLIAMGTASLFTDRALPKRFLRWIGAALAFMFVFAAALFLVWQIGGTVETRLRTVTFSVMIGALTLAWLVWTSRDPVRANWQRAALLCLVALDLFTVGHSIENYTPGPALATGSTPPLVTQVKADTRGIFRVDGARGVFDNNAALWGVLDIRGISPLRLDRYEKLFAMRIERLWEVLAVRYVFSPDRELSIPGEIVGTGTDPLGAINLHRLTDPRPFARMVYQTWIEPDDGAAVNALASKDIDVRRTAILPEALPVPLIEPDEAPQVTVTNYAPEAFRIYVRTAAPGLLDISQVNTPDWKARLDGRSVPILRSNVALLAVLIPAGEHDLYFSYEPDLYRAGLVVTLLMCVAVCGVCALAGIARLMYPGFRARRF